MSSLIKVLDGSVLEGGGQTLRMAVGLCALVMQQPLKIVNIRAGRAKPGLKAQHMTGIQLVGRLVSADVQGCSMESTTVTFSSPITSWAEHFEADTKTAGAVTLLAQVALPVALFRPVKTTLELRGGTNADMAPQIDYYTRVFLPNLKKFGAAFECDLMNKGYFPKGRGHVRLQVLPVHSLTPVKLLEPGRVVKVTISASVAGTWPVKLAEEMAHEAKSHLLKSSLKENNVVWKTEAFKEPKAFGNGSSILLVAETDSGCVLGGSAIGSAKKSPRDTGRAAAQELVAVLDRKVCLDSYAQDQVIMYMALANGHSQVLTGPLTLHTETAIHVAKQLTKAQFEVRRQVDGNVIVECQGVGLVNSNNLV